MRCSITIYKWRNLFLFCGNFAGPSTLVTNVEAGCFHEALHLCSFYSLTLRFLLFILNLLIYRWVVLCRSYRSKPSGETCRFLRGSILYYVRTVLFVLQTYNLVWVILWQIWTVLAGRLGCGPFSLMLTAWYIVCQGSEPNGETSQFLTGSILYYVRIAATTLLAWPRIWSSVITTRIAWVNNALIAHNSQKGYWQFFIS